MKVETKILRDINKYGWHIIHVLEDNLGSGYSYTIGLEQTFNHSEIVISGLSIDLSIQILNEIGDAIKEGKKYNPNERYDDILEGYDCIFKSIPTQKYNDYFGRAKEYYQSKEFQVIQCFYPDKNGLFPFETGCIDTFQEVI